jgi:hypothetical protein
MEKTSTSIDIINGWLKQTTHVLGVIASEVVTTFLWSKGLGTYMDYTPGDRLSLMFFAFSCKPSFFT